MKKMSQIEFERRIEDLPAGIYLVQSEFGTEKIAVLSENRTITWRSTNLHSAMTGK